MDHKCWNHLGGRPIHRAATPKVGTVTARNNTKTFAAMVNVVPGVVHHISVAPNPASATVGTTQQFTGTAYDVYNNVVPSVAFAWTTKQLPILSDVYLDIGMRSYQLEKIEYLKNIFVNSIIDYDRELDEKISMFSLLDSLTISQIRAGIICK